VSDNQQFKAKKSIAVWQNVWQKFGICQHETPIPSEVLAKCMATRNAMAAEVQVLVGDMQ